MVSNNEYYHAIKEDNRVKLVTLKSIMQKNYQI